MLGASILRGRINRKHVGDLSGGERGRLHLAHTLKQGANVLLLDEPSNDLDIETLRALEEAILAFPGCVLVISHDRWFLDRVASVISLHLKMMVKLCFWKAILLNIIKTS